MGLHLLQKEKNKMPLQFTPDLPRVLTTHLQITAELFDSLSIIPCHTLIYNVEGTFSVLSPAAS